MIDILRYSNIFNDFADKESRKSTLEFILEAEGIEYEYLEDSIASNIVVKLYHGDKYSVPQYAIGAHYDKVSGSKGINDNAVAVATLIKLAKEYVNKEELPIDIVFFDKEETGMSGSRLYAKTNPTIKHALILDIIGYGDTPILCAPHGDCDFPTSIRVTDSLPSDNMALTGQGMNASLIVTVPRDDLEIDGAKVSLKKGPSFYSSFHGKPYDDIKYINWSAVKKIYNDVKSYIASRSYDEETLPVDDPNVNEYEDANQLIPYDDPDLIDGEDDKVEWNRKRGHYEN